MTRRIFLLAVLLLGANASVLAAQVTDTVRGRLIDQDGNALADQRVVLHRVVGSAGANIAETRSDSDGGFTIPVDSADNTEAVYFLAARWEGELYIGEAFRAPVGGAPHVLQVGVPGTSASALIEGTTTGQMPPAAAPGAMPQAAGGRPATRTSWLLFAVPAIALLGVIVYFLLRGRAQVSERRRLLREIAELDLQHEGAPPEAYRGRREALLAELRETSP